MTKPLDDIGAAFAAQRRYGGEARVVIERLALPEAVREVLDGSEPWRDTVELTSPRQGHEQAMSVALWEAAFAFAEDEVPVGAVVLDPHGRILGRGRNLREQTHDPCAHAEVVALRHATQARQRWRLEDCTLLATLEPCPMCAGALVNCRIAAVVYGASDPKAGACGSVLDLANVAKLNHRFPVQGGILEHACGELLREYFRRKRR